MSSTREERRVRRLWEKGVVPAARRVAERGVTFFPMGPTDEASWYTAPPEGPDFFTRDPDELQQDLEALWRAQELPELVELAGRLAEIAREYEIRQQEPDEISPFVYVMY